MHASKLTETILAANKQGRPAMIPYLPAGFPNKERFWKELQGLAEAGADIIEIGVPFSDPVADGPVVEKACLGCLRNGINLDWLLRELKEQRDQIPSSIVLMGYYNPFLKYGLERFAEQAAQSGVNGVIVPDLPLEEAELFQKLLRDQNIDLIALVGLNTSRQRMERYAAVATGFVYYVSVLGTTGQRETLPEELHAGLVTAQEVFDIPVALGFGIRTRDQLEKLKNLVDGVVIGSALISHIEGGGDGRSFLSRFSA